MSSILQLAKAYRCLESVDRSTFQRKARVLQAMWRESLGYPMGEHRGRPSGSRLRMPWAEQSMANFLDDDIRCAVKEVLAVEHSEGDSPLIESARLFSNLLSSQPLAFNLFGHLRLDVGLATDVLRSLSGGRIAEVATVDFEFSPGRGDTRYTGDRSAFDVYVRFVTPKGDPGFAGIEVKYHEDLANKPSRHHLRYDEVADEMGCFLAEAHAQLRDKPLQQIWRDHLLADIHRRVDGFADGFFVFLNPAGNDACNQAVAAYRRCLTREDSFVHWTLETIVEAIRQRCDQPWVAAFADRYLAFEKLDHAVDT